MARETFVYERHAGGLEAPRNSLELQIEAYERYRTQNIQDFYYMEEDQHRGKYGAFDALSNKLISEEMSSKTENRKTSPNIIARLMGMDMSPLDKRSPSPPMRMKSANTGIINKERNASDFIGHIGENSSSVQIGLDSYYCLDERQCSHKARKSKRREHPQEEELRKFKREFEAWQSARFSECAKNVELSTKHQYSSLQKEAVFHENDVNITTQNAAEMRMHMHEIKPYQRSSLQNHLDRLKLSPLGQKETYSLSKNSLNNDFEQSSKILCGGKPANHPPSSKIVLLKPCPDRIGSSEDSQTNSSGSEERGSIEDFLQEVKERLKCELEGRSVKRGSMIRGGGIETPFWENPSNSKQIAQKIAKRVRERAMKDLGTNSYRSESTRAYRSELQLGGVHSQNLVNRDAKRFWSERLRNVLKRDSRQDMCAIASDNARSSFRDSLRCSWKRGMDSSYLENIVHEQDMKARSFRCGPGNQELLGKEPSPKSLVRSLSEPVSRASFAKLLLEDSSIPTDVQIRRKHENLLVETKTRKKERFSFREKVHNIKYNFGLRGRLFSRKMQTVMKSEICDPDLARSIARAPTVLTKFTERLENLTEVPPSPASMCSSAQEEFWRRSNTISPISTPDMTLEEDELPKVFEEISLNLKELKRQLKLLESGGSDEITAEQEKVKPEVVELDDQVQAYIRDLLTVSGLYDGSLNMYLPLQDMLTTTISNAAFEQVEESYRKLAKDGDGSIRDRNEKLVCRKLLCDLLNEILPTVLMPPIAGPRFRRKITASNNVPPLSGMKLLSSAWEIIRTSLYPPVDQLYYSLEDMVSRELHSTRWSHFLGDPADDLAGEMERIIFEDEIEDVLKDICC